LSPPGDHRPPPASDDVISRLKTTKDPLELEDIVRRLGAPRNVRDYTTIISAWTRVRRPDRALALFDRMRSEKSPTADGANHSLSSSIEPTLITFNAAIAACAKASNADRALELLDEVRAAGMEPDAYTYNATISACAKGGRWELALELFSTMRDLERIEPDVFTYAAALTACDRGGLGERAVELLREMQRGHSKCRPDAAVYALAMSACAKRDATWPAALALFDEMRLPPQLTSSRRTPRTAAGDAEEEEDVVVVTVGGVEPDGAAYGAVVAACDRGALWERASACVHEMRARGFRPHATTYAHAVSACAKARRFDDAKRLFDESRTEARWGAATGGVGPPPHLMNNTTSTTDGSPTSSEDAQPSVRAAPKAAYEAMLLACAETGKASEAVSLIDEFLEVHPDSSADVRGTLYARGIAACDGAADAQTALKLLDQLEEAVARPDLKTYAHAISACHRAGRWETALEIFDDRVVLGDAREEEASPEGGESSPGRSAPEAATTTTTTAETSSSSSSSSSAEAARDEAASSSHNTDDDDDDLRALYNAALSACDAGRRADRALDLLDELRTTRHVEPDAASFAAAMAACEKAKRADDVLRLLGEVRAAGLRPDAGAYGAAASAFAQHGAWEDALTLLDDMRRDDVEPDALAYSSVVHACEAAGRVDYALDVYRGAAAHGAFASHWRRGMLDLVDVAVPVARTAVRSAVADAALRPKRRRFHDAALAGDLVILTGQRRQSAAGNKKHGPNGGHALRSAILKVFDDELGGELECRPVQQNAGRLVVPTASLLAWAAARDHMREQ